MATWMIGAVGVQLAGILTATALAEPQPRPTSPPSGLRLVLSDLTLLRLNPIGLESRARFGLQQKIYDSTSKLVENNFWFAGLFPKLNPAFASLGIGGEIQPASIFNLRAFYEVTKYFGTFGYLASFPSPNANYSDRTRADRIDNPTPMTEPQAATAARVSVQPTLQVKLGAVVARTQLLIDYFDFRIRAGDRTAYDATYDTLLPDGGWAIESDTDLLYVSSLAWGATLTTGLRHSWVHPFYSAKHFADPADELMYDGNNAHQRLGFLGAYTFRDTGPSLFNKPSVVLIVAFYLQHRYRTGEPDPLPPGTSASDYRTRAYPYVVAGFAFESDFLAVR